MELRTAKKDDSPQEGDYVVGQANASKTTFRNRRVSRRERQWQELWLVLNSNGVRRIKIEDLLRARETMSLQKPSGLSCVLRVASNRLFSATSLCPRGGPDARLWRGIHPRILLDIPWV
jgi:hypothetical protein